MTIWRDVDLRSVGRTVECTVLDTVIRVIATLAASRSEQTWTPYDRLVVSFSLRCDARHIVKAGRDAPMSPQHHYPSTYTLTAD